ncbi:ATP-binding cassette domain-containing protein [Yinghuangia aomiensis]
MIAGLEQPSSGQVLIGGQDVTGLPPYKRPVNTACQNLRPVPAPHGRRERRVSGLRRSRAARTWPRRSPRCWTLVSWAMAGRKPAQLSGGQQQRVRSPARSSATRRWLLLDERSARSTSSCAARCSSS